MRTIITDGKAEKEFLKAYRDRNFELDQQVARVVSDIIDDVRKRGDEAVDAYTLKFDGALPSDTEISKEEMQHALAAADSALISALKSAAEHIRDFHARQKQSGFIDAGGDGVLLGQRVRGLDRVGIYVPGGTAAYPSSVLMNAIPAKIAGVKELIMVTPPDKSGAANPDILAAAALCGIDRIFLMGGAQAIAALAFGTDRVPKVDKIVGPGNIYVATAKRLLFGVVDIDMIAGPSEILVLADEKANAAYIAADLMSQAEHDRLASSVLVSTSQALALEVEKEIDKQIQTLPRKDIIREALDRYGAVILCRTVDEAIALANEIAPEHLEVMLDNPMQYLGRLDNAGSIFLGDYAPEPLGDYYAGPNHVLPTGGTARFFSPLSVDSFIKRSSFIYYTGEALNAAADHIVTIARREGLTAHANAITVRTKG